jgi:hypothetical protein
VQRFRDKDMRKIKTYGMSRESFFTRRAVELSVCVEDPGADENPAKRVTESRQVRNTNKNNPLRKWTL